MNIRYLAMILFCTLLPLKANTAVTIEITQGLEAQFAVAVVPFKWQGQQSVETEQVDAIVKNNLQRSGRFSPVERYRMPEMPSKDTEVTYNRWKALGVDSIVTGTIEPTADSRGHTRFKVRFQLLDVFKGPNKGHARTVLRGGQLVEVKDHILLDQAFVVNASEFRRLAHKISDLVYEKLTGIKGIFSTKIAYVIVSRDGPRRAEYRLELADADGANAKTLLNSSEPLLSPAWSPDGRQLAYVSFENKRSEVYIQDISSGHREVVANHKGINSAPAWSPDGRQLALSLSKDGNPELYVLNLQTKKLSRVTRNRSVDTEPQWLPDGRTLIYTSDRGGRPHIYQQTVGTVSAKRLTFEGTYNARPQITPDGKNVVMVHQRDGSFHIASLNLNNGGVYVLSDTTLDESPSIAPNGSMVIFATQAEGRGVLSAVSLDGRVKLKLPAKFGEVREPAWSPFFNQG